MSTQLNLTILELLVSLATNFNHSTKFHIINDIVSCTNAKRAVQTINFYGAPNDIAPYTTVAADIPKIIFSDTFDLGNLQHENNFNRNILFIAVSDFRRQAMWQYLNSAFANMQQQTRGIFIKPAKGSHAELLLNFEWFWYYGFTNTITLLEKSISDDELGFKVYTYRGFPKVTLLKLDISESCFYLNAPLRNLYGYAVRTPAQLDPPRVMQLEDVKTHKMELHGYAAEIFKSFLANHNGTMRVVQHANSQRYDILAIMEQVRKADIDISMHPYMPYKEGVRVSYPIKMMRWCILVPFNGEIHAFAYFLRPFQHQVWILILLAVAYLTLVKALYDYLLHRDHSRLNFGHAFLEVVCLLLYQPLYLTRFILKAPWHAAVFYIQVGQLGFILTNLYTATLASFLTTLIFQHQINSIAEMVQRNLSIQVIDYELPLIVSNRNLPEGFAALLIPRTVDDFMSSILNFHHDTGHGYAAREDLMDFVLTRQQHLTRPLFHMANECFATVPIGFLMSTRSQFERVLNTFVLRTDSAGLTAKWFEESYNYGLRAGILHRCKDNEVPSRYLLTLEYFQFAWIILIGGSSVAFVVFALENLQRFSCRLKFSVFLKN